VDPAATDIPAPSPDRGRSPSFHETSYRVRFDESGPDGLIRTSAFMRYAQDLAWQHSTALGFGREWYASRGLTWLVRAAELVVLAPVPMSTSLVSRTEVVGIRRVWARRRGTFRLPDGTLAGWVNTDWVLIDGRGALTRIPAVFTEMFGGDQLEGSVGRLALPRTPDDADVLDFAVRPHDLDPMGHANNAAYVDWLEESVGRAEPMALRSIPRRYRLEYALAADAGSPLAAAAWLDDGGWSFRLAHRTTGVDLFRGRLETDLAGVPPPR